MRILALASGFFLLTIVLLDAFQTIILPRRAVGRFRITRAFFLATWFPWRRLGQHFRSKRREQFYSVYGPFSLLLLFFIWAVLLTAGFGLVYFGLRIPFKDAQLKQVTDWDRLCTCFYVSGTTLFTLGLGDVTPQSYPARVLTVLEGCTGFGFIALMISYVPVLYAGFSQREVLVAMLDARAGSPPTATELLLRHDFRGGQKVMRSLLAQWERWCAEILESHISYPILCYYRSQHDNQSWLAALTAILDTCALLITMVDNRNTRQAQLTFAMGRHVLVDLVHIFRQEAVELGLREAPLTRLSEAELDRICSMLQTTDLAPHTDVDSRERLLTLRKLYEPAACALSEYLRYSQPLWVASVDTPAPRTDIWSAVKGLRAPRAAEVQLTNYLSTQATAVHLEKHGDDSD